MKKGFKKIQRLMSLPKQQQDKLASFMQLAAV
jgi:hypothetical protein